MNSLNFHLFGLYVSMIEYDCYMFVKMFIHFQLFEANFIQIFG